METIAATGAIDPFIALYSPSFDPSNPTANLITCDDDGAGHPLSIITANLSAGTQYEVVVTTWNANPVSSTISWRVLPDIILGRLNSIPTLSEWGMIIFSILLCVSAVFILRKNRLNRSISG
jgi:hypothetical protein